MPDVTYVRVLDQDTGHELSVPSTRVSHGNYKVLKGADALDVHGQPLPPKYKAPEKASSSRSTATSDEKKEA